MSHQGKAIHCKMSDTSTNEIFVLQRGDGKKLRTEGNDFHFCVIFINNNSDLFQVRILTKERDYPQGKGVLLYNQCKFLTGSEKV